MKLVRAENDSSAQYFYATNEKLNSSKLCKNLHVYSYKTPITKAQPNFLQNQKKTGKNFNYFFVKVLTISFLLLYKLSECRILQVKN